MNTLSQPLRNEPDVLLKAQKKINELQKKLNFYEHVLNAVPANIYITGNDRSVLWCNQAYEEATGYTLNELRAMGPAVNETLIHPDDLHVPEDKIVHYRNFFGLEFGGIFRAKNKMQGIYKWFISWARSFERDENGYLEKVICVDLDMTHQGESHMQLINALKESLQIRNRELAGSLTLREKEILKLICQGKNNREISEGLFLSHHTIETHRKNIRRKLHARNPAELTLRARDFGLD